MLGSLHPAGPMNSAKRTTLVTAIGLALAAGGCSLTSPGGSGTYSSLQPNLAAGNTQIAALPEGFEPAPARALMPGDPTRAIPDSGAGRVDPVSALSRSARARDHWETLTPRDTKAPVPAVARAFGADRPSTPAAASAKPSATDAKNYDRDAAMQNLINGGKSAGQRICNGC